MRFLHALILLPLFWLAGTVQAAEGDLQPVPELRAPLTDLAHLLSDADAAALNRKLLDFSQQKGSQIAVLIIPTTQPESVFDYSFRVATTWKLGRKGVDDGVLLVVAVNDRRTQLQVGYGLEGAIPDARSKQVLQDIIAPKFHSGDFAGGLNDGVDALIKLINGEALPAPAAQAQGHRQGNNVFVIAIIAGLAAGWIIRSLFGRLAGSLAGGGVALAVALLLGAALAMAVFAAIAAVVAANASGRGGFYPGGLGGGGFGGGGFGGGGGFSGGGGGFGGGGSSGSW